MAGGPEQWRMRVEIARSGCKTILGVVGISGLHADTGCSQVNTGEYDFDVETVTAANRVSVGSGCFQVPLRGNTARSGRQSVQCSVGVWRPSIVWWGPPQPFCPGRAGRTLARTSLHAPPAIKLVCRALGQVWAKNREARESVRIHLPFAGSWNLGGSGLLLWRFGDGQIGATARRLAIAWEWMRCSSVVCSPHKRFLVRYLSALCPCAHTVG